MYGHVSHLRLKARGRSSDGLSRFAMARSARIRAILRLVKDGTEFLTIFSGYTTASVNGESSPRRVATWLLSSDLNRWAGIAGFESSRVSVPRQASASVLLPRNSRRILARIPMAVTLENQTAVRRVEPSSRRGSRRRRRLQDTFMYIASYLRAVQHSSYQIDRRREMAEEWHVCAHANIRGVAQRPNVMLDLVI
jgi:hypothetical protein